MLSGRPRAALVGALLVLACARGPSAAAPPSPARAAVAQLDIRATGDSAAIALLIDEGTRRSHVTQDLEYLTDVIGPRLTGSAGLKRANEWTASKMKEYGVDTAGLERWPFGIGWQRGP